VREVFAIGVNLFDGLLQADGGVSFSDVSQHQAGGLHERRWIGHAFAGDVRS